MPPIKVGTVYFPKETNGWLSIPTGTQLLPSRSADWCRELLGNFRALSVAGKIRTIIAAGDADGGTDSSVNIITLLLIHT